MREPKIDRVIFGSVVFVVVATCIPLGMEPDLAGTDSTGQADRSAIAG